MTVLALLHKLIQNIIKTAPEMCACIVVFKADTNQCHQTTLQFEMSNSFSVARYVYVNVTSTYIV